MNDIILFSSGNCINCMVNHRNEMKNMACDKHVLYTYIRYTYIGYTYIVKKSSERNEKYSM